MPDEFAAATAEPRRWRPLSERTVDRSTYGEALYEGVPDHLRASLVGWATAVFKGLGAIGDKINRILGRTWDLPDDLRATLVNDDPYLSDDKFLEIVDVLLHLQAQRIRALPQRESDPAGDDWSATRESLHDQMIRLLMQPITTLQSYLAESRSVWSVGPVEGETCGLIRRVDATIAARAETTTSATTIASQHLRRAWASLYRREPDYGRALDEANAALEAAARPVVSPRNRRSTLGTIIRDLKAAPQKWTCELGTVDELAGRLDDLWSWHRHGTDDPNEVKTITHGLAEAAVHEALTLVHWFMSGAIRPADA